MAAPLYGLYLRLLMLKVSLFRFFLAIGLLPLVLSGCGGGSSSSGGSSTLAAPQSVSATASDGLTATLSETTAMASASGSVTYSLTISNPTSEPITLLPDANGLGFTPNVDGAGVVITNSAGQVVAPAATSTVSIPGGYGSPVTLNPGQFVTGSLNLPLQDYSSGSYFATATLYISPSASASVVSFSVGPLAMTVQ